MNTIKRNLDDSYLPMYFGNLLEEYIIVMIDTESHEITVSDRYLEFGLAGAILLELTIRGRIAFKSNNIIILERNEVDDAIIQEGFDMLLEEEEIRSALYWVRRLSNSIDDLKERVIKKLEERDIIEVNEDRKFLIFKTEKFKVMEPEQEQIIKGHIRDIVDTKEITDPRALGFLSLIYATGATNHIFTEDELEEYIQDIRALVKDEEVGKSVSESIQLIIDALMRTQIVNYNHYML